MEFVISEACCRDKPSFLGNQKRKEYFYPNNISCDPSMSKTAGFSKVLLRVASKRHALLHRS